MVKTAEVGVQVTLVMTVIYSVLTLVRLTEQAFVDVN